MENCLENLMVSARTRQVNEASDRESGFRGDGKPSISVISAQV